MDNTKNFTVRLPLELNEAIEIRCAVSRRKKNAEIIYMLEQFLHRTEEANLRAAALGRTASSP